MNNVEYIWQDIFTTDLHVYIVCIHILVTTANILVPDEE